MEKSMHDPRSLSLSTRLYAALLAVYPSEFRRAYGGPVNAYNEIWPLFTTDAEGIGNGKALHVFTARPEAQAVVIHAPGGVRIACADLN